MRHILVIQEDPAIRRVLRSALQTNGYDAIMASDLESAWEKLISHKPVAVLCDTETPGTNAGELTRRMRAEPDLQDIPVILLRKPFDSLEAADVTDMVRSGLESQARPRDPSAG